MGVDGFFKIGDIVEAEVLKISNFGAFVKLPNNKRGLIHISQISDEFVNDVHQYLKIGDKITARVKKITPDGKIDLTLKKKKKDSPPAVNNSDKEFKNSLFGERLDAYLNRTKNQT